MISSSEPLIIDATGISTFSECPQRFYWEHVALLRPPGTNFHFAAGIAIHAGLHKARLEFHRTGDKELSEIAGARELLLSYGPDEPEGELDNKSPLAVLLAYTAYLERWPLDAEPRPLEIGGRLMSEVTFAIPLPIPGPSGDPVLYAGKIDWISTFGGKIAIFDEKTTSRMSPGWGAQFDLRGQFIGYLWAAAESGIDAEAVIVRGIGLKSSGPELREVPIYRKPWLIEQWLRRTAQLAASLCRSIEENEWMKVFSEPCARCPFTVLCTSREPEKWFQNFERTQDRWNPLDKSEGGKNARKDEGTRQGVPIP